MLTRRAALVSLASVAALLALPRRATASVARAVSLKQLAEVSQRAVVGTPLQAASSWQWVGGSRRIVTDTRVRVDARVAGGPTDGELLVRTLGGRVGDVGQVVHGEAALLLGEPALLFLRPLDGTLDVVTGMSQGHYPVRADDKGTRRLRASPRSFELTETRGSAVEALVGRELREGLSLVEQAFASTR